MMNRATACVLAGFFLSGLLFAQERTTTRDPIRDYLNHFETHSNEKLVSSQVDLNGDGMDEVFLSRTDLYNGRQGNIWVLYESLPEGNWKRHDELTGEEGGVIEFHPKAVSIQSDGSNRKKLIRYSPGSASTGWLTTFRLGQNGFTESLGREIAGGGKDSAQYDALFNNPDTHLDFHYQNMDELRSRYLPFNGWFHQITAGKLIFILICLFLPLWLLRNFLGWFSRGKKMPS